MLRLPPRRILAAVDPSLVSFAAWSAARGIAERFGAVLEAIYCEPFPVDVPGLPIAPDPGHRARVMAALRRRLGPGTRLHAVRGEPAYTIRRVALDRRSDLIVMGTHRRRGAARLVLGSTAEAVARAGSCPVLVVPARLRPIRTVLAPVHDGDYARRGLLAAGVVARAYKARLRVLNVVADPVFDPRPEGLLRALIAGLPEDVRRDARPETDIRVGEPLPEILKAARGCDLLVVTAHRKSLLGDWVLGTTAERLIRHSSSPVLVIPSRSVPARARRATA